MLTSVATSSFPSLILLSLCEKHQQTQTTQMTGRSGLQARGEIRRCFGKHFSKHWLKLWGSGFLHILEWRMDSDAVSYMISHFLNTPYPSPIFESCGDFWSAHLELWLCKQGPGLCWAALSPLVFAVPCAASAHSPSWALLRLSCDKGMCWGTSPGWHCSQDTCPIPKSPSDFILGFFSVLQCLASSYPRQTENKPTDLKRGKKQTWINTKSCMIW